MKVPEIETARLHLRSFRPDDLDALSILFRDEEVVRYLTTGKTITRKECEKHLANYIAKFWEKYGFGRLAVVHKERGLLLGYCGLQTLDEKPELVYLLAKEYWGVGLATEAAEAWLRFGFEELRLDQVIAVTRPQNTASRRVLEKIGMKFEKEARFNDIDCLYYSISRNEYRPSLSHYAVRFLDGIRS